MEYRTGYFSKIKQYTLNGFLPVSISRWPPKWYTGKKYPELAPSADLLKRYKDGVTDDAGYDKEYNEFLKSEAGVAAITGLKKFETDVMEMGFKGVVLCCFEKPGDFCHRHLLADEMSKTYGIDIEEFDIDKENERLGRLKIADLVEDVPKVNEHYLFISGCKDADAQEAYTIIKKGINTFHLEEKDHLTIVDNGKESVGDLIDKLVEKYPQYGHKTFGDKEFTEATTFVSREKLKTGCKVFAIHFWDGKSEDIKKCISEADRFKLKSYVWDTENKKSIDNWHEVVNPEGDWYSKCLAEEQER
jgi:predicted CopG family antitoxin